VAGAGGIGKHHAKWHHLCGSEVVAFLGSSRERCDSTAASLGELFGFAGRGYVNMAELLERERPHVVDVCTPNHLHYGTAMAAIEAGCHVLCEKPLVWQEPAEATSLLARARQLVEAAAAGGRHLGVCTQYATSLEHYDRLYRRARPEGGAITGLCAEMETLSRGRDREARDIWVDMGSHPLSLLLAWIPEGHILEPGPEVTMTGKEARAVFDFGSGESRCRVDIAVRDRPEGAPVRRYGINGVLVDCGGRAGEDGVYRSVLRLGNREELGDDFMYRLIRQFTAAVRGEEERPLVPGTTGLRNLQLQLELLAAARPG